MMIWMNLKLKMTNRLKLIDNSSQSPSQIKLIGNPRSQTYLMNLFCPRNQKTRKSERIHLTKMNQWKMKTMMLLTEKHMTTLQKNRNMMFCNSSISNINKIQKAFLRISESFLKENLRIFLEKEKRKKWNQMMFECKLKEKSNSLTGLYLKGKKKSRMNLSIKI